MAKPATIVGEMFTSISLQVSNDWSSMFSFDMTLRPYNVYGCDAFKRINIPIMLVAFIKPRVGRVN